MLRKILTKKLADRFLGENKNGEAGRGTVDSSRLHGQLGVEPPQVRSDEEPRRLPPIKESDVIPIDTPHGE